MSELRSVIILILVCSLSVSIVAQPTPILGGGMFGVGVTPFYGGYSSYGGGYGSYNGYPSGYGSYNRRPYYGKYRYPHFYAPIAVLAG